MAIELSDIKYRGLNADTAYAKITSYIGSKSFISFSLTVFASKEMADLGIESIGDDTLSYELNSQVISYEDMYNYAKTKEKYANGVDV